MKLAIDGKMDAVCLFFARQLGVTKVFNLLPFCDFFRGYYSF